MRFVKGEPHQTIATYLFYGLGSTANVESSEGEDLQPVISFPGGGNNPVLDAKGLYITEDKYVTISGFYDNDGGPKTGAGIWIFHINGLPCVFAKIGAKFSMNGFSKGTALFKAEIVDAGSIYQLRVNVQNQTNQYNTFRENNKWNLIGFGINEESLYNKICTGASVSCPTDLVQSLPSSYSGGGPYHLGCKSCNGNTRYLIHSLRISTEVNIMGWLINDNVPNKWASNMGDGVRDAGEQCDDGNLYILDGCSPDGQIEPGFTCLLNPDPLPVDSCYKCKGAALKKRPPAPFCDDRNTGSGDGCNHRCHVEAGWTCQWQIVPIKISICDICGNGKMDNPTSNPNFCDDGNVGPGDGCNSVCRIEAGWECTAATSTSASACKDICHDGRVVDPLVPTTYCDDGDWDDTDGCNTLCAVHPKWKCTNYATSPSTCVDLCGDGFVVTPGLGYCDDGGLTNGDGCDQFCHVEPGWNCILGDEFTASICIDWCGDARILDPKAPVSFCDDGDYDNNDGCSSTCAIEIKWTCGGATTTSPSICKDDCGDGYVITPATNYCDDGNFRTRDGCSPTCTVESGWACTPGDPLTSSVCIDICGDGRNMYLYPDIGYCDDGNSNSGDGCSLTCGVENAHTCTSGNTIQPSICKPCNIANCIEYIGVNVCICSVCEQGYEIYGHKCKYIVTMETYINQIMLGLSILAAGSLSLLNMSSPNGIWTIVNQLQSLLLLLEMNLYLPVVIVKFILSNIDANFNFAFFSILDTLKIYDLMDWLGIPEAKEGVEYMQTIPSLIKHLELFVTILGLMFIHSMLKCIPGLRVNKKSGKLKKAYHLVMSKAMKFFTLTVYIRMVIESFQILLLTSFKDFYFSKSDSIASKISVGLSGFLVAFCVLFYLVAIYKFCVNKHVCFSELENGLKKSRRNRIYTCMFLTRKLVLISWVVFSHEMFTPEIPGIATFFQGIYVASMIYMRPFEELQTNIIEIINEIAFMGFAGCLIRFNTKEVWSSLATLLYLYALMANNVVVLLILLLFLAIGVVKKCKKWRNSKRLKKKVQVKERKLHQNVVPNTDLSATSLGLNANDVTAPSHMVHAKAASRFLREEPYEDFSPVPENRRNKFDTRRNKQAMTNRKKQLETNRKKKSGTTRKKKMTTRKNIEEGETDITNKTKERKGAINYRRDDENYSSFRASHF